MFGMLFMIIFICFSWSFGACPLFIFVRLDQSISCVCHPVCTLTFLSSLPFRRWKIFYGYFWQLRYCFIIPLVPLRPLHLSLLLNNPSPTLQNVFHNLIWFLPIMTTAKIFHGPFRIILHHHFKNVFRHLLWFSPFTITFNVFHHFLWLAVCDNIWLVFRDQRFATFRKWRLYLLSCRIETFLDFFSSGLTQNVSLSISLYLWARI